MGNVNDTEQKYSIIITQITKMDKPGRTIREMLGTEFEEYYDGWDVNVKTKESSFFFFNVPEDKIILARERMAAFSFMKIQIDPMETEINVKNKK